MKSVHPKTELMKYRVALLSVSAYCVGKQTRALNISPQRLRRAAAVGLQRRILSMPNPSETHANRDGDVDPVRISRGITQLLSNVLHTRLLALEASCNIAETYLRFGRLERARVQIASTLNRLAAIEAHLDYLQQMPDAELDQLGRHLERIRLKIEALKAFASDAAPFSLPRSTGLSKYMTGLCTQAGIDIYDLGHKLKMLPSELQDMFDGLVKPPEAVIQGLAHELNCDARYLENLLAEIKIA
jgi:hypothetical protein